MCAESATVSSAGCLLAFELGLALLEERVQALLGVLGREGQVEQAALVLEAELERALVSPVDAFLGEARRDRGFRRDLLRERLRLVEPVRLADDPRDEAGGQRFLRPRGSVRSG